jgi:hypothetical protein
MPPVSSRQEAISGAENPGLILIYYFFDYYKEANTYENAISPAGC